MDDCDLVQQLPMDCHAPSSPSTRMARPFWTMTLTPHSILPHPRQQVFTTTVSFPMTSGYVDSAKAVVVWAPSAAAAPAVMAAVFTNERRDIVRDLLTFSSFSLLSCTCVPLSLAPSPDDEPQPSRAPCRDWGAQRRDMTKR